MSGGDRLIESGEEARIILFYYYYFWEEATAEHSPQALMRMTFLTIKLP